MKNEFKISFAVTVWALSLAPCASAQTAQSADTRKAAVKTEVKAAPAKQAPAAAGGLVVFIDPETKQIRQPDTAEIGSLGGGLAPSSSSTPSANTVIYGPGGAVGLVLDESTMSYMVVSKTPDGKLDMDCVTGAKPAAGKIQGAQPAKKEVLDVK